METTNARLWRIEGEEARAQHMTTPLTCLVTKIGRCSVVSCLSDECIVEATEGVWHLTSVTRDIDYSNLSLGLA